MVETAREHESEDRQRRELVEARNAGDGLVYQTEKTLKELGDKVPAAERSTIESKVKDLRATLEGEDKEKIKRLSDDLQNAFHAISQQLYAQQAQSNGNGASANGHVNEDGHKPSEEGEVVEGEFRDA